MSAEELREALSQTLRDLRAGKIEPAHADAVAMQAREILRTVKTQLEIFKQSGTNVSKAVKKFAGNDKEE